MRYKHWVNEGQVERALDSVNELHKAQERFPSNARGWYELAYMYGLVLRDTSKALQYASKAYALNPNKENSLILQTLQRVNDRTKGLLIPSQSQSEFNFVPSKD